MDWSRIEELIDKYFDGQTTLKEQAELREAFNRQDCPEQFKVEAQLMNFFTKESTLSSDRLQYVLEPNKKQNLLQVFMYRYGGVAAAVAVFFLFFYNNKNVCDNQPILAVINNQKICDEAVAKQHVEEALHLISLKMNQSTSKFDK